MIYITAIAVLLIWNENDMESWNLHFEY